MGERSSSVSRAAGRPPDAIRHAWATRFALPPRQEHRLDPRAMAQLSRCKSDEARRLLLGVREG